MKITAGSIVAGEGEHVLPVGPISGTVTLDDGSVVDVTAPAVVGSQLLLRELELLGQLLLPRFPGLRQCRLEVDNCRAVSAR